MHLGVMFSVMVRRFLGLCIISVILYSSVYQFHFHRQRTEILGSKRIPNLSQKRLFLPVSKSKTIAQKSLLVSHVRTRKLILSWTGFFKYPQFLVPSLSKLGCKVNNCDVTSNRQLLNRSDAVLFHWPDVNSTDLPEKKFQRWFMLSFESPVHTSNRRSAVDRLGSNIDYTITYRRDSDIVSPYGEIKRRRQKDGKPPAPPSLTQFSKKSKVSWMVSHCRTHGKRETIVRQLRRLVKVDLYGKCGGKRLPLLWNRDKAYTYLAERYMFYLSFENAICKDYLTEKVFMPLHYGLIPVVFGGADYKNLLPPNSYIDILDFPSLTKLAAYLNAVSLNYTLYLQYFEWRKTYFISKRTNDNSFFCDLCSKLNSRYSPKSKRKSWFRLWWYNGKECVNVHRRNVYDLSLLAKRRNKWF